MVVGCSTLPPVSSQTATQNEVDAVFDDKRPERGTLSEYQLQDMVMDFADLYVLELWQALDEIRRVDVSKEVRTTAQYGKVLYASAAMSIAAGQYHSSTQPSQTLDNAFPIQGQTYMGWPDKPGYWCPVNS
jgi:hypothetical protein